MSRARSQNKVCGCAPSPCSARGDLCLSPPGPRGWKLGGLFTFNLAMKLTPGAWERDESFQLGGSPECQSLAKVLASRADRYRLSPDARTAPLPSQLSHHPSCQPAITPHIHADPHDSVPKSGGQTATLRDTCTYRAIQRPATGLHTPQATRLSGRPAHRFHFISATPLLDSQKRQCSATASLLLKPLGTWSFPVPLRENLCSAKLLVRWFCKPRSALETPGFL